MERLKIEQSAKERIKAFIVTGFNVVDIGAFNENELTAFSDQNICWLCFVGSVYTPYGGYIGLPSNYTYKSVNYVDKTNIYIRSEPVDWNSSAGESLAQSLVLNESEQAFGISRAILELQSDKLLLNTILPSLSLTAMYLTAKRLNVTLDLFNKPRGVMCFHHLYKARPQVFNSQMSFFFRFLKRFTGARHILSVDWSILLWNMLVCPRFQQKLRWHGNRSNVGRSWIGWVCFVRELARVTENESFSSIFCRRYDWGWYRFLWQAIETEHCHTQD